MREQLMRDGYDTLSQEEKRQILLQLGEQYQMQYQKTEIFSRWGKTTETAIYTYQGSEFVFVPGCQVTLGWHDFAEGMDAFTRAEVREVLDEYEIPDSIESFLRTMTSPVRQAIIGPMLVERRQQEIGWEMVALDDPRILENDDWLAKWKQYRQECSQQTGSLEIVGEVRFQKIGETWKAAIYHDHTRAQHQSELAQFGFALPTVDEWEYLCGGGCRTLFAWGDRFPQNFYLRHFEARDQRGRSYTLEEPNFFGLIIGFDPYRREIVDDAKIMFKGGDGGCNVCGGMGAVLGYFPCSPYYVMPDEEQEGRLNGDFDFLRRVLRIK